MQGTHSEIARGLLAGFSLRELGRMARHARLCGPLPGSRAALSRRITEQLTLDDIVEEIHALSAAARSARPGRVLRLDQLQPCHGPVTVQAYSHARPAQGHLLLERGERCHDIRLDDAPAFLENRRPVFGRDAGTVPAERLFAAFIRPRRIHPEAQCAPPRTKPYIIDEGEYQLRNARLRIEFNRAGPVSFLVVFLRNRGTRPEYLLEPIA